MLDSLTVYGTRVWLPFDERPVGQGSLFIIDPLYTLPLLLGLLITAFARSPARRRWTTWGLALSTLYAGWSVAAQAHVTTRVMATPEAAGLDRSQVLVIPTPFNTVLWRIVLRGEESYQEGFYSLLDSLVAPGRAIRFREHDRGGRYEIRTAGFEGANMIREFSKGFYALADDGDYATITDLRMGQHPFYAFSFAFAKHQSEPLGEIAPVRYARRMPWDPGIEWLQQRALGKDVDPPAG